MLMRGVTPSGDAEIVVRYGRSPCGEKRGGQHEPVTGRKDCSGNRSEPREERHLLSASIWGRSQAGSSCSTCSMRSWQSELEAIGSIFW
jgi:hypothetical protein